jgi:Protein of unknown function (DUF1569)
LKASPFLRMLFYLPCTAKLNFMDAVKLDFIQHQFTKLVNNLAADAIGKWGKMNAQQMVEHVTDFFNVSAGKIHFDIVTPLEHIPKYKEFLLSDKEFRENTKAPASVLGEAPLPLRSNNMQEAIAGLQKSIDAFVESFTTVANKTTVHPVFGVLNFEEWVLLHYKHVTHHGRQFGIV